MEFKNYYVTKDFAKLANKNQKTIKRLKKDLIKNNPNTKLVIEGRPDKYHYSLLKNYISPRIFKIILDNKSYLNTIKCLKRTDSLEHKLFKMPWKWWCTVSYSNELSKNSCRDVMDKTYHFLENKYGAESSIRMFYTTESFSNRDEAHHNHFVLDVEDANYHYSVKKDLENLFDDNRIHVEKYDDYKPCIFYCTKEGMNGTDWDILGNNLIEDGINYE